MKRAVFLDRDGTMITDVGYLRRVEDIHFFPWTVDAIRALDRAGLTVVVTTNQSGIARGVFTAETLDTIHAAMGRVLDAGRAPVRAYYYCPHHPTKGKVAEYVKECDCRKPAGGMVQRAARDLGLDPARSFVVGDTWLDVGLARSTGAKAILVRTGGPYAMANQPEGLTADAVVDNLAAAASWILRSLNAEV